MLGQGILTSVLEAVDRFHGDDPGVREALLRCLEIRTSESGFELEAVLRSGTAAAARISSGLGIALRAIERGGGSDDLLTKAYEADIMRWNDLLVRVRQGGP